MKTFQKLLTNSLLFAENRLCRKEDAEKQGQQSAAPEEQEKFEIGQVVEGYGLTKEDNVTVEKIEKVQGHDKVTLSDKTVIERVKFEFDKDGKKEPTWLTCRKLNTGTYVDKQGEQPLEFAQSQTELMPESEAIKQLEEKANEAKKKLEEAKKKALEGVSEPNKEQATQAIEEKYKKAAEKIDKLLSEAKTKITEEREDGEVEKSTAEELAKAFDVEVKKASEEGEKEMGFEAEFKGKLKNPEELHAWLKDPTNRQKMRELTLVPFAGGKRYTVDFKKAKEALNLDDKEYEIVEKNLRIGNLLEDDVIKKITSVKTKGKEMVAKYFYEGGEKVKGIYTEKNKYIPIWDGTEISLEPGKESALEEVKSGDKDFEKKVTKAKATAEAPAEETIAAPGTTPPAEGKAAEAGVAAAGAPAAAPVAAIPATPSEATSADAAKALGEVDKMPTLEPVKSDFSLWKPLENLIKKGATKLSIIQYKNIDTWTKKQLGLAETATNEDLKAAREKTKEQTRVAYDTYLEEHVNDQEGQDSYKELYEAIYGTDFSKVTKKPKVFTKYLDLTGKTILTDGVTGKTDLLTWGGGDDYFKAYIDNTKQSPQDGDVNRAAELTAEKKDFVKKLYSLAKASVNPVAKVWALDLGSWLAENEDPEAQTEKKTNFEKLRASANDKTVPPEERIKFIKAIKNTAETELQAFGVGKTEFEKECKQNLAKAYFDGQIFEDKGLEVDGLEDPKQRAFVEAFKDVSTIRSRAQLKGLLETPGVKPESFVKMAEKAEKIYGGQDESWIIFEIYTALKMNERVKALASTAPDLFVSGFYLATIIEEDPTKRQKELVKIASHQNFSNLPGDFQMTVFERLLKEGIPPDLFKALNELASRNPVNVVLRARLMQARLEMAQAQGKGGEITGQKLAELGLEKAEIKELKYDPKAMFRQTKDYIDALGDSPSEADYALLKELHALYHGPTATRKFDENFKDDPESQKTYASLMYKLYEHTKDQKYLEGIDQSLLSEFGDAKFVESQGDKLYQQALQEADPAKRTNLMSQAANEYLQSALKEKDAKKKLLLSSAYSIALENGDSALVDTIIGEYEKMDDQESQETVVDMYLQRGDYEKVADLLKTKDKISARFMIKEINALVVADYARYAEDVCMQKGMYTQVIDNVYRVGNGQKLEVMIGTLFSAALNKKLSHDSIFNLLKDNDHRGPEKFVGSYPNGKVKFCRTEKDAILGAPGEIMIRIIYKLDFADVEEFKKFISEDASAAQPAETAPVAEPTPTQPEQAQKAAPEQKDHAYTVEGNIVNIITKDNKKYKITLDFPSGFTAETIKDDAGDNYVVISDKNRKRQVHIKLNNENAISSGYTNGADEDKYKMSYEKGVFKLIEKEISPVEEAVEAIPPTPKSVPAETQVKVKTVPVAEQPIEQQKFPTTNEERKKANEALRKLSEGA